MKFIFLIVLTLGFGSANAIGTADDAISTLDPIVVKKSTKKPDMGALFKAFSGMGMGSAETSDHDEKNYLSNNKDPRACSTGGVSLWSSALNVVSDSVIPQGGGYNMGAGGWPKISSDGSDVEFEPGSQSMCTSATASAFAQYIADLNGQVDFTPEQIKYINGPIFREAFNGNTYSVAYLNQQLGGKNAIGTGAAGVKSALLKAKPGDIMKFDRSNGTGHSTIFQEIRGDKVCYWSSNRGTKGPGTQCESMTKFTNVAVSRLPPAKDLPKALDRMRSKKHSPKDFYTPSASDINDNGSLATCGTNSESGNSYDNEESESAR